MRSTTKFAALILTLSLLSGAAAAHAQESLQFAAWTEPTTAMFSAELPLGWSAEGSVVDLLGYPQPHIVAYPPEQTMLLIAGMDQPYVFTEPNPAAGLTEGSTFNNESLPVTVWSMPAPTDFLQEYLTASLSGSICEGITFEPLPAQPTGDPNRTSGEVRLTCTYLGNQATGYFFVNLYTLPDPTLGMLWLPADLYGYLAEPGFEAQAEAALLRLASTLTVGTGAQMPADPAMQQGMPADPGADMVDPALMQPMPNDPSADLMDQMMAQQLQSQMDQMMRSHTIQMFNSQMYWNCVNTATIYGTPADCGGGSTTQYEYDYDGDGEPGW
jgi:hypothetical protein